MNIEQHELRIQQIIQRRCEELGVIVTTTVVTGEDSRISFHNTYDLISKVHRLRTTWSTMYEMGFFVFGITTGFALALGSLAALVVSTAIGIVMIMGAGHYGRRLHADPMEFPHFHQLLANTLAEHGYTVRVENGTYQINWE